MRHPRTTWFHSGLTPPLQFADAATSRKWPIRGYPLTELSPFVRETTGGETVFVSEVLLLVATTALATGRDAPGDDFSPHPWDFEHLHLRLTVDPRAGQIEGTAIHTVRPLKPQSWLRLHGVGLHIDEVRIDEEATDKWRLGHETLDIAMPDGDGPFEVAVRYSAEPQSGMHFRQPRTGGVLEAWTQGQAEDNRHWLPAWDEPTDRFTYSAELTVPAGLVALTNGVMGEATTSEGMTTTSFRMDQPVETYLLAVTIGDYRVIDAEGPVPLEYVGPRTWPEEDLLRTLETTPDILAYLDDLLGTPYGYPVYRQVLVGDFLYGGMENTTHTVLADTLRLQPHENPGRTERIVAHEIAHQWFGDRLGCYGWRDLWLNEGFATYYAGRWLGHAHGEERFTTRVAIWRSRAFASPNPMAPRAWSRNGDAYPQAPYTRGALVLHALRQYLGDQTFDDAIATYVAEHSDQLVESADLRRVLDDAIGEHLGWFFDTWVHGAGVDGIAYESSWTHADGSLEVVLEQTTPDDPVTLPIAVEIGNRTTVTHRVVLAGPGTTRLAMPMEDPPDWVAVDPDGAMLAKHHPTQIPRAWLAQLHHSPSAYARLVAARRLARSGPSVEHVEAIAAVASDTDRDPVYRALALEPLQHQGALAEASLIDLALDEDGRVRAAAIDTLGKLPASATTSAALSTALDDRDPAVAAAAMRAMGEHDPRAARQRAVQRLRRPDTSSTGAVHEAALGVLGTHGNPSDLSSILRHADDPLHVVRSAAMSAATARVEALTGVDRTAAEGTASTKLVPLLDHPDQRTRFAAIGVLARVGDRSAERALAAFAATRHDPSTRDRALDAAAAIRLRGSDDPSLSDADAARLTERIQALQDRLERLEERY